MWICPYCNQRFKHINQAHTCMTYSIEDHVQSALPELQHIYQKVINKLKEFGPFDIVGKKGEIILKKNSTFLAFRFMKSKLRLIFYLDHLEYEPPVNKFTEISRNRVIHQVDIYSEEEIDERLLLLLTQAYDLID